MKRKSDQFKQMPILVHHFFGRLFRNDVMDFEDQMKSRLAAILSIIAVITGWISNALLFKYLFVPDANLSWQEKNYIYTLVMTIFGIVTLLEWEMLFLDRQDCINLVPLPIKLRTIFYAKIMSFIAFVGLFSIAMTSISSVLFSIYLGPWGSHSWLYLIRFVFAHLISSFAACLFIFFICVFIRFFFMTVLPFSVYSRTSLLIRFIIITFLAFLFMAFVIDPKILDSSFHSLARFKNSQSSVIYYYPPLWFVGLYEVLLGNRDRVFSTLAIIAEFAVLFSFVAFVLASGLSFFKHVLPSKEVKRYYKKRNILWGQISGLYRSVVFRYPEEKAIAEFFSKTIRSSPKHRMTLINIISIAVGFDLLLIAVNRKAFWILTTENISLLVQPLILSIVILIGIRVVVNIPVAPDARWIFQVTESPRRSRYLSGLKKAIFFNWSVPISIFNFLIHLFLWRDWRSAFNHTIFILIVSSVAIEGLYYRFRKIPFACINVPGKIRIESRGLPYLILLISSFAIISFIERELLREPKKYIYFIIISVALWAVFRIKSVRFLKTNLILYEEKPDPIIITMQEDS